VLTVEENVQENVLIVERIITTENENVLSHKQNLFTKMY